MTAFWVCLVCTFAHIPSIFLRYVPFQNKISKKQRLVLSAVYLIALLANFVFCFYLELNGKFTISFFKINLILFCMIMAAVNIIVIKGFLKEHLFAFGLTAIIVLILYSVSAFIAAKLIPTDINKQLIGCNIFFLVLFIITYYPSFGLMKKTITPFLEINDKSYWNIMWFIPISMFFASVLATPMNSYITTVPQLISRILIGIATLFICFFISGNYKQILERENLYKQLILQKQYYQALAEKVNIEREMRHNFKHHVAAIQGFIDAKDMDGLIDYCEIFQAHQPHDIQIPYTGNSAVDGVLYHYASMAKSENILFKTCCSFKNISISDIDLCNLLGNALDNAVTACKSYEGSRYINVAMENNEGVLSIVIDNSFDGVLEIKNDKILSKKRINKEGIGISCMKKICADYNGTCKFTAKDNQFEASFLLQN